MRRRTAGAKRSGQNGAGDDGVVARGLADGGVASACAPGPLPRPAHVTPGSRGRTRNGAPRRRAARWGIDGRVVDGASTLLGRYGGDTVSDALVAGWGLHEISSILRWALADLAVALLEIERRQALSSHETRTADGPGGFLHVSN